MEISQKLLGYMLLTAVAVGGLLGIWYDFLSFSRMLVGLEIGGEKGDCLISKRCIIPAYILQFVEDVIFGLSCGVTLVLLLYYTNDGRFRAMAVIGMAVGYGIYRMTIGRLSRRVSYWLVQGVHQMIKRMISLLFWPLRGLYHLWLVTFGAVILRAVERRRKKMALRYTERENKAYIMQAAKGFKLMSEDEKNP